MKFIFLDIDGVLNSWPWYKSLREIGQSHNNPTDHFDPQAVQRLNWITEQTGAKIVVSSSWRKNRSLPALQQLFREVGGSRQVIGKTKVLRFQQEEPGIPGETVPRGNEIHQWLSDNRHQLGNSLGKYRQYVILDDDSDMLYWQRNNFVRTDAQFGLTDENAQEAVRILNKETSDN